MSARYAIYAPNGRISRLWTGPDTLLEHNLRGDEQAVVVSAAIQPRIHWINPDTGKPNKRTRTPCTPSRTDVPADGTTHVTLSQMREGTEVQITGPVNATFTASGSEQITFAVPGTYTITATASFPALSKTVTIHAS